MTFACPRCDSPVIHDVVVVLAGPDDLRTGLLGWASAVIGDLRVDGLAVRITGAGRLTVTWPARRGHPTVIPVDPDLFRRVEAAVLEAYTAMKATSRRGPA